MRQQQMASLGRLLADFSHEMRNHLAVIQEANGLLEDMLAMEEAEDNPLFSSLGETALQIRKRIQSAAHLCRHLSVMAHRSDTPRSWFQVNDLLAELVVLLERSIRSGQIIVQLDLGQGIEPLYNEPALLQYVLYQLYTFSVKRLRKGQSLLISTVKAEQGVEVRFCLDGIPQLDLSDLSETVMAAMSSLEATLEEQKRAGEERDVDSSGFSVEVPSLPVLPVK